jgi:transcriptional regulator with XRE-family HTH domain
MITDQRAKDIRAELWKLQGKLSDAMTGGDCVERDDLKQQMLKLHRELEGLPSKVEPGLVSMPIPAKTLPARAKAESRAVPPPNSKLEEKYSGGTPKISKPQIQHVHGDIPRGREVGVRLKEARKAAGWAIKPFAEKIGYKYGAVAQNECIGACVGATKAAWEFLRINRQWLYTGEGEMFTEPPPQGEPVLRKALPQLPLDHDKEKVDAQCRAALATCDRLDITIKVSTAEFQLLAAAANRIHLEEYVKRAAIGMAQLSCRGMGMKLNEKGMLCE